MRRLLRDERGQSATEFITVVAVLALIVVALVRSPISSQVRSETSDTTCSVLTPPQGANLACGAQRVVVTPVNANLPGGSGAGSTGGCAPTGMGVERGLSRAALNVLRCSIANFGSTDISGRLGRTGAGDHPHGNAIDYMVYDDFAKGQEVAAWAVANAQALGIKYVIWYEKIWQPGRGWTLCSAGSCYSGPNDTLAHRDHVHISVGP